MSSNVTPMGPPGHITSATEPYPSADSAAALAAATTTHRQGARWAVTTRKLPISKAGPIDALTADLGIPVPEMIFGDNLVRVRHAPSGWAIAFAARDALDAVDKTGEHMLQVSYARDWSASRHLGHEGEAGGGGGSHGSVAPAVTGAPVTGAGSTGPGSSITMKEVEVVKPFDWSYSTEYRGTVEGRPFAPTASVIPIELLKRRDPILFFDNVVLYESELDDNGISMYSVKVRVHEQRMLLLARLYMRLDNVVVRIRDTRVYVDFATDEVIREYTKLELSFAEVQHRLRLAGYRPDEIPAALRDANQVADLMSKVPQAGIEQIVESVSLA